MNREEIIKWLNGIENDEVEIVYLNDGKESCIAPNMGYALRDEIFEWQDQLDDIDYSEEGFSKLYLLVEDVLDSLENRMVFDDAFLSEINQKAETNDYVKVSLPERTFFDLVNLYTEAKKIGEVVSACNLLINYVQTRISDIDCNISDGRLWIKKKNNVSLSTSIIAQLLNIDSSNIDDSSWDQGIWSIHLYRR